MIKVDNVSMRFNLGIEKNFSLKLFFINLFKTKKKKPKKEINKSVKLPTWFDNEQKDINVSEEEKKEIEALLKEFK